MAIPTRLFFGTADTTVETLITVTTGRKIMIESITMMNGAAAAATTLRFNIGAADTAATRIIEQIVPAGPTAPIIIYPRIFLGSAELLSLISTVTDDVCVVTVNGYEY